MQVSLFLRDPNISPNVLLIFHMLQEFMYFLGDSLSTWQIFLYVNKMFYYRIYSYSTLQALAVKKPPKLCASQSDRFHLDVSNYASSLGCLVAPPPTGVKWHRTRQSQVALAPSPSSSSGYESCQLAPFDARTLDYGAHSEMAQKHGP